MHSTKIVSEISRQVNLQSCGVASGVSCRFLIFPACSRCHEAQQRIIAGLICIHVRSLIRFNMSLISLTAKIIAGLLTVWAIYTAISAFLGIAIYFPLRVAEGEPIPEHRWQSVRVAVCLTFAYYGIMYLLRASKEVYPVHFLKVFLFMVSFSGLIFFRRAGVEPSEYNILALWFMCAVVLHLASRPHLRRYFSKKK